MSYISQANIKKEKILKLIADLQVDFYSDEENWGNEFRVKEGIEYATRKELDKYDVLKELEVVEDKQFCILNTKSKSSIYANIDKMLIDTYRMEIINFNKGSVINLDTLDRSFFDDLNKRMKYRSTFFTDYNSFTVIDTVYVRWYYGRIFASNGQGCSPFTNTVVRLARNVLWEKYKKLLRDYPTVSFEFKLLNLMDRKYKLYLTGAVDVVTQVRYSNALLKHISEIYGVSTLFNLENISLDKVNNVYFDFIGERYTTSNKDYIKILLDKNDLFSHNSKNKCDKNDIDWSNAIVTV